MSDAYLLSAGEIFTLFFIMLGPIKVVGPFFAATNDLDPRAARKLAMRICGLATVAIVLGGLLGDFLLTKWRISVPVLQIAAGLVFLLAALQTVLAQYQPSQIGSTPDNKHLLFPVTVTPYGIAAVILLLASIHDAQRGALVLAIAILVIFLDLLAMVYAKTLLRGIGPIALQILGAVLGVLQVALALAILLGGLHKIGFDITP